MERDKALAEAIKTIRKAQGWRVCPVRYGYWHGPGVSCDERPDPDGVATCWAPFFLRLPDPLADTPEGDHAFMEILRWAEHEGFLWFKGDSWMVRGSQGRYAEKYHANERIARLLALAAALEEQGLLQAAVERREQMKSWTPEQWEEHATKLAEEAASHGD